MYYFVNELHSISNDMNVNKNFSVWSFLNFFLNTMLIICLVVLLAWVLGINHCLFTLHKC